MKTMTIKSKLYLAYGVVACLALGIGVTAFILFGMMASSTHDLGVTSGARMYQSGMANGTGAERASMVRAVFTRASMDDQEGILKYKAAYESQTADFEKQIAALRALGVSSAEEAVLVKCDASIADAAPMIAPYYAALDKRDLKTGLTLLKALVPVLQQGDDAGVDLLRLGQGDMAKANEKAQSMVSLGRWIMGVMLIICLPVGVALVFIIQKLDAALTQSSSDLTEGAQQVTSAASQVSSSSQSLARDTSEQAAMIEETSASAEEINSMAKRNTESARNANQLVVEAVSNTQASNVAVNECVLAMNEIGESSSKIAKTLQVIDKIAFQTNILALNAAVEAARAGEAGMGFAVVAEEVRNLAQRCAAASEEISVLIEQSLQNSDAGRAKISTLVESGARVNGVFESLKVLVEEISLSSDEQSRGIEQIGRAIQKMEQGTQKSAANAEESAAAAEELNAQAEQLSEVSSALGQMVGIDASKTPVKQQRVARPSRPAKLTPIRAAAPRLATHIKTFTPATGGAPAGDDSDFMAF
jgi:methyl-accepting chemotaxis protein/methyl-accepting chemotaxis protein-1 (serine sensor receptor)